MKIIARNHERGRRHREDDHAIRAHQIAAPVIADFLLVNLNNTSTKLALSDHGRLLRKKVIPTRTLSMETLRRAIGGWKFEHAVVGSDVPK